MEEKIFEKIPLKDWRKYALGDSAEGYKTDEFYCQLANDIYEIIRSACGVNILPSENMHILCVRLSQYVEDVVSDLGIFQAFRDLNKSLDNRSLPFYAVDESYDAKLLNVEDIRLLLWDVVMAFNTAKDIPSPFNPDYERIANELKVIMDASFNNAPVNQQLYDWLYPVEKFSSYNQVRERLLWMSSGCYLTASYAYDKELSYLRNLGGQNEADEGDEYRWYTKFTPVQNKMYFSEVLMFDKTSRLLSLPYKKFYAQMLQNKVRQENATLVGNIEATFQKFQVKGAKGDKMQLNAVRGEHFIVDLTQEFINNVKDPNAIGLLIGSVVKFDGRWILTNCRKYVDRQACEETGEDYYWYKMEERFEHLKDNAKHYSDGVRTLQKDNVIGFYRNSKVCTAEIIEAYCKSVVEKYQQIINSPSEAYKDQKEVQESTQLYQLKIEDAKKELHDAQKKVLEIKARTSIRPVVVAAHKDNYVTAYENYATDIDISSNTYASPSKKLKESIEYIILHCFDSDLAVAVLTDPSLKKSDNNLEPDMKRVRSFVAENAEFVSRYCYHDCFCGNYKIPYKYPDANVML